MRDKIGDYRDAIGRWESALTADGDLLLYGCDLAVSDEGRTIVRTIGDWTGTDVAASTDLTGSAWFGGDWDLEYRSAASRRQPLPMGRCNRTGSA